jgi:aerobic-type carbon monoxide dehydrogenase small subunit (CoxS/CutS family)
MATYTITINRKSHQIDAHPSTPLLWVLRDHLNLTGTKYGCGAGVCGACTVLQHSRAVRSCQVTIAAAAGKSYTTIEGLSADGTHPCQRAWLDEDVAQCGFCQPGMILEAVALLRVTSAPAREDVDRALGGHICRCGTYTKIRAAVLRAASEAR